MLNNPDGAIKRVKAFCQSNCSSTVFLQTHSSVKTILNRLPEHIYLCGKFVLNAIYIYIYI